MQTYQFQLNKVLLMESEYPYYFNSVDIAKDIPIEHLPDYNSWSCTQWINFHKELKSLYGKKNANEVWKEFFNNKPSTIISRQRCTTQDEFKSYFKSQGINFDQNSLSIISILGFSPALQAFNSLSNTAKAVIIIGGSVAIIGIGAVIFISVRKTLRDTKSKVAILSDPKVIAKLI